MSLLWRQQTRAFPWYIRISWLSNNSIQDQLKFNRPCFWLVSLKVYFFFWLIPFFIIVNRTFQSEIECALLWSKIFTTSTSLYVFEEKNSLLKRLVYRKQFLFSSELSFCFVFHTAPVTKVNWVLVFLLVRWVAQHCSESRRDVCPWKEELNSDQAVFNI